jgi:hypothetical protein
VPVLLRRMTALFYPGTYIDIPKPIRVGRDKSVNDLYESKRQLTLAANKAADRGCVLVLLDADDDCPARLGPKLQERLQQVLPGCPGRVILAQHEYESWFIAAADSLAGFRGLPEDLVAPDDPERKRDAKGWIGQRMGNYDSRIDQPALTSRFDIVRAESRSRSFRKFCSDFRSLLDT